MFARATFALFAVLLLGLTGCAEAPTDSRDDSAAAPSASAEAEALHALFAEEWASRLEDNPLFASRTGSNAYNDRLPDVSPEAYARRLEQDRRYLERLEAIERAALSAKDRLNYDLFAWQLEQRIAHARFRDWRIPLNSDSGFHMSLPRMHEAMPFRTVADYENYLARLNALPAYFEQQTANMRMGLEDGFTLPKAILSGVLPSIEGPIVEDPENSVFFEPFEAETGIEIAVARYDGGLTELRAQAAAGRATWDVIDMLEEDARAACAEGLLAPLDGPALAGPAAGARTSTIR